MTETSADWRIQLLIAAGTSAAVATDILSLRSGEIKTQANNSIR
ncbi:hypothetical protein [Flavobacterium sp. DSP2-3-1]